MNDYIIETGIPIPKTKMTRPPAVKSEAVKKLEEIRPIVQSMFFRGADYTTVSNYFSTPARRNGIEIVIRKVAGGTRLWRMN